MQPQHHSALFPQLLVLTAFESGEQVATQHHRVLRAVDSVEGGCTVTLVLAGGKDFIMVRERATEVFVRMAAINEAADRTRREKTDSRQVAALDAIMTAFPSIAEYPDEQIRLVYRCLWDLNEDITANTLAGGALLMQTLRSRNPRATEEIIIDPTVALELLRVR